MIAELRTLIAVARYETFAAAGARIGLTQSAISGQMRRLEDELGFKLFDRTGRTATLNAAGLETLERARSIVASVDALGKPGLNHEWEGALRIGAIGSAHSPLLIGALKAFHARFARCRLHILPGVSLHLLDQVDTGAIDLAIIVRPSAFLPDDLVWTPLVRENYALIAPADLEGDDWRAILKQAPFIRYDRASFGGRPIDKFLRHAGVEPHEWLEMDELPAIVSAVSRGVGVAILPMTRMLLPLPENVKQLTLTPSDITRDIGAVHRKGALTPVISAFIEALQEYANAMA